MMYKRKIVSFLPIFMVVVASMVALLGNSSCAIGDSSVIITYDANGGDVSLVSEVVQVGSSVILPTPTYQGHVFCGWYNNAGVAVGVAGASYIVSETMTLYAQWMPGWSVGYTEKYAYERGHSLYYVEYELHYYVNGGRYETYVANAYFDNYASAWAFSLTGGPVPIPYNELIWIDNVNRWWVVYERDNYRIEIYDEGDKITRVYYGHLFPGTDEAPPFWFFTVGEYTGQIAGMQGQAITSETRLIEDPGFFGGDEPIIIYEYWWTTTYSGWVNGDPDVYSIHIVPVNGIIYSCR